MRVVKLSIFAVALTASLAAPSFAQTPPTAQPPKPQTPPATGQPPATATPAAPKPAPTPPVPFPQDSKIAFVDFQAIASNSAAGRDATKKLQDLQNKKLSELQDKNKQLQALTTKRDTSAAVLSEASRAQLEKDIDRLQREIQFAQQNSQAEIQELQNDLMTEFQKKLAPIIEEIAKEKGLYVIFSGESAPAYIHPGLNISEEVVKRLDAKKN